MSHRASMSDIVEEMDSRTLAFIKKYLTSFTRWDLIRFFAENIHTYDTAEGLAKHTGRPVSLVQQEAANLAADGILTVSAEDENRVYALTLDPDVRRIASELVQAAQERTFRMKLVYHILRAGGQQ